MQLAESSLSSKILKLMDIMPYMDEKKKCMEMDLLILWRSHSIPFLQKQSKFDARAQVFNKLQQA